MSSQQASYYKEDGRTAAAAALTAPAYFSVSVFKLIVMSTCTMGIYEVYWFYKNWALIKERERADIRPFWRAFFSPLFCYACLNKISRTARSLDLPVQIAAGPLSAGWVIVCLLWRLPEPYWLASYLAVFFLVPVQILANGINKQLDPSYEENRQFGAWNIAAVVIGGAAFILLILGSFNHSR